jgi:hypothetical protein
LHAFSRVVAFLSVSKGVEFAIGNDGCACAVEAIPPKLVLCAGFPLVGKASFIGGAILIGATPAQPALGGLGKGGARDKKGSEEHGTEVHEVFHTTIRGETLNFSGSSVKAADGTGSC